MTDKSGCLKWEVKDQIGIIRISGIPSSPITNPEFADIEVVKQWISEEIRGVIISGEGRHFSAGADLKYFEKTDLKKEKLLSEFDAGRRILDYIENLEKPVIASIDGICFGAGLEIALACHMRFCSNNTVFCFPEVNHGIIPGLGGIDRLVKVIGRAKAVELILTGEVFDAQYVCTLGLVNKVVEAKSSFDYTFEFMKRIINRGTKPIAYALRAINNVGRLGFAEAIKEECHMFAELVIDQYRGNKCG